MKKLLAIAILTLGFSYQSFAQDDMGADEATTHEATEVPAPKADAAPAKKMAMSMRAAKAACKKEGKRGTKLADCIKEKRAVH